MTLDGYNSIAGKSFREIIPGRNLMTPKILGYIKYKDESLLEVSKSESSKRFAVTVIRHGVKDERYCASFTSITEMEKYVKSLVFEDHSSLLKLISEL